MSEQVRAATLVRHGLRRMLASRRAGDGTVPVRAHRRTKWITPVGLAAAYLLLALAVHLRMLDSLDLSVGRAARPGEVWGPVQMRAGRVVDEFQPVHLAVALLLFAAVLCLLRRSLRPLVVVAVVGPLAALATLATKFVMAHWDPGATPVRHSSFPSGHTVTVIVVFGLIVLLLRPGTRWGWIAPAIMGCFLGSALILASVHPATDVIGGGLLAGVALTGATAARLGQWASGGQGRRVR